MTLIVRGGVVDHKRPVNLGGAMWDPANHWGLCKGHHDGYKRLLEHHAEATGQIDRLQLWCDDPTERPVLRGD